MRRRSERGFTLVELMVSLVVFSFVVAGILAVAVSMTNGYREQRQAISNEGLVRVPIDYIGDALRQASPAVPSFNIQDANTCSTSALTVVNSSTASDSLDVIYASGGIVTATKTAFTSGNQVDVVDVTGLAQFDYIVISNLSQGHFFRITLISGNTLTLQENCASFALPAGGYNAGSIVVRAQHARFSIAPLAGVNGTTANALWMDPDSSGSPTDGSVLPIEPLAENIEDMQVAVGVDTGSDGLGVENTTGGNLDEWVYNHSADTAIAVWPPATGTIRAVRVTLISRSPFPDSGNGLNYTRPATEDRAVSAADNYRRRTLKTTIEFRNGGISP